MRYLLIMAVTFGAYSARTLWVHSTPAVDDPNEQDHFVHTADAWLHGSFSIADPPSGMIEIIHPNNGNYLVYGPMPTALLLPFVAIGGLGVSQSLFCAGLGAINAALAYSVLRRCDVDERVRLACTVLFALGTTHFFAAAWGSVWYCMHVVCAFFILLAVRESYGRGRPFVMGLLLAAAFLTRPLILLCLPFFLLRHCWSGNRFRYAAGILGGLSVGLVLNGLHNLVRFDSPWTNGYQFFFGDVHSAADLFSLKNVPKNVYAWFLAPPDILRSPPFLRPERHGMSVFLVTPALLVLLKALPRNRDMLACWVAAVFVLGGYACSRFTGFSQFGSRYLVDVLPFLLPLLALGLARVRWRICLALVAASVAIQFCGLVTWIWGDFDTPALFSMTRYLEARIGS